MSRHRWTTAHQLSSLGLTSCRLPFTVFLNQSHYLVVMAKGYPSFPMVSLFIRWLLGNNFDWKPCMMMQRALITPWWQHAQHSIIWGRILKPSTFFWFVFAGAFKQWENSAVSMRSVTFYLIISPAGLLHGVPYGKDIHLSKIGLYAGPFFSTITIYKSMAVVLSSHWAKCTSKKIDDNL